jgi:hypothetical protein
VTPPRLLMEPTIPSALALLVEEPSSLRHCLRGHLWYLTILAEPPLSLRHCLRGHLWYLTILAEPPLSLRHCLRPPLWCPSSTELTLRDPP